ncbi:MAG: tRNA (adenosine(37)-N6)-threonylcarbamoyltransferase complex ATPase subunit type 1 TsaE [Candidatus Wildermuthbacteria bacterium]|nr:tRNA (adenosine(37)-N6)-threonylcarbamoyltransferase complex ATPase subunit type 1 TsaE [Candidatus Wildermuthbacteria bacterium]
MLIKTQIKEKIYLTNSPAQTKKLGTALAQKIIKEPLRKQAVILSLKGNLGGGKTTFLQGFAKGLGIKEKINSPTFIIMRRHKNFYHFDCYRIKKLKEILDLGFKEIISEPKNIIAIEWADKIEKILPGKIIRIRFKFISQKIREINMC